MFTNVSLAFPSLHCNKLSAKSVHCACLRAPCIAVHSLVSTLPTRKQIWWRCSLVSDGTSGLAVLWCSTSSGPGLLSLCVCAHMAEVSQLTPLWDDPPAREIKAGASAAQMCHPPAEASLWLRLPSLQCLCTENDFHAWMSRFALRIWCLLFFLRGYSFWWNPRCGVSSVISSEAGAEL